MRRIVIGSAWLSAAQHFQPASIVPFAVCRLERPTFPPTGGTCAVCRPWRTGEIGVVSPDLDFGFRVPRFRAQCELSRQGGST